MTKPFEYLSQEYLDTPESILKSMMRLRKEVAKEGMLRFKGWKKEITRRSFEYSARNFADYLALRRRDLRDMQDALLPLGLSSLGRSEARVLPNLDAVIASLNAICGLGKGYHRPTREEFMRGEHTLGENAAVVLGKAPDRRPVRMMITLPSDAASNYTLVSKMLEKGMNCARINCAHDSPTEWEKMIHNIRRAEHSLGLSCKIFMDLAGPKVRTADVILPKEKQVAQKGDLIFLYADKPTPRYKETIQVRCGVPEILTQIESGDEVWIDDGKIGTIVESATDTGAVLRVTIVEERGRKLKADKGLNFPTVGIDIVPLTEKDIRDLDFICAFADGINYSFVQSAEDIRLLQTELKKRHTLRPFIQGGKKHAEIALVAKIETKKAVERFPEILIQGAGKQPFGVMIARGDLAVEIGYQRIAEIQEELLWLCEAAHVPVIWATQVLETLVKKGIPSRAEITDAAMAERAECVMLNKGDYILEAIEILDNVLMRMGQHQRKKMPKLRQLYSWRDAFST